MPSQELTDLAGTTALVTGAGRGFGRGIVAALSAAGASVVAVARDRGPLEDLRAQLGDTVTPVAADASDPVVASRLIEEYRPRTLVLNAGASPVMKPLQEQTWETFSSNWEVDVRQVFHWTTESLLRPLDPGSIVIAFSSGAALGGSPLSGGYAGAKATIRFIASYAAAESERGALGVQFVSVLPRLTPATDLGAHAVAAYAAREGLDVPTFIERQGPSLTPEHVGKAILQLATAPTPAHPAYLLTSTGLTPLS